MISEDWSPIDASKHAWDSPLASHAVSADGLGNFNLAAPSVDQRTKPTGKMAKHYHPHWTKEDPKNFPINVAEYEIHEPEQNAYGDWAAIVVNNAQLYDIRADRGQAKDVAAEHPEVVADLRKQYDTWWKALPPFLVNEGLPDIKPGEFPIQKLRDTQGGLPLWEPAPRQAPNTANES